MRVGRTAVPTVLAVLILASAACATASLPDSRSPSHRDGPIITRDRIERSGAVNGWEALRYAGTHLSFQEVRQGSNDRVTHRGVSSFYLSSDVLLVVDGAHMPSLGALKDIPAKNIAYMQVLPGRVGVIRYGTSGGNGVVVVQTEVPEGRPNQVGA